MAILDPRRIPKAVATSSERKIAIALLSRTNLLNRFEAVATGDEVAKGKPSPELFLLVASRLGIEPAACLVLEDSESGVIAAHGANMPVFFVPERNPTPTAGRLANGTFDSLAAVADHLKVASLGSAQLRG